MLAIGCPVIELILFAMSILSSSFFISVLLLYPIATFFLIWKKYKEIKTIKSEITKAEETKNNIVPTLKTKKKAIFDIVTNDNLSESEKEVKCKAILESIKGGL